MFFPAPLLILRLRTRLINDKEKRIRDRTIIPPSQKRRDEGKRRWRLLVTVLLATLLCVCFTEADKILLYVPKRSSNSVTDRNYSLIL